MLTPALCAVALLLPQAPAASDDSAAVVAQVQAWADALVKADSAALRRIIAPDYITTTADGRVLGREADVGPVLLGLVKFERAEASAIVVRVYGNTAVVMGIGTFVGRYNGQPFSSRERFTDVYVKRDGRWVAVASQSTAAAGP